jgi:hypothetical protein
VNKRLLLGLIILAVIGWAIWWLTGEPPSEDRQSNPIPHATGTPTPAPAVQAPPPAAPVPANAAPVVNTPDIAQQQRFLALFDTPISFFGRVVDETGSPVSQAVAAMSAANVPYGNGSKHEKLSDDSGLFEIVGIRGAELYVEVKKDGYYQTENSRRNFRYAGPPSNVVVALPTKETPATFVLKQRGTPASLIHISERPIKTPKNGTPVQVSLRNGRTVPSGEGDLQVEVWTEDAQRDANGQSPWRCRITVPGGGLIERTDPGGFEAPADGYKPFDELKPAVEKWSSRIEKQYFLALHDGCFARIEFRLRTDGEHYFVVASFLNPQPGSRNLEYDRSLRITPPKRP